METIKLRVNGIIRNINLCQGDMTKSHSQFDMVICSSFEGVYDPRPGTFINSLNKIGINVEELSKINGGGFAHHWIEKVENSAFCKSLCCVELSFFKNPNDKMTREDIIDYLSLTISKFCKKNNYSNISSVSLGTGLQGLNLEEMCPLVVNLIKQCFEKDDDLIEFNIYFIHQYTLERYKKEVFKLDTETHDVFLSHSFSDKKIVSEVYEALTKNGVKVWYNSIEPSEPIHLKCMNGVENSTLFLFLHSKNSAKSPTCKDEIKKAIECEKTIIIDVIDDYPFDGKPLGFGEDKIGPKYFKNDTSNIVDYILNKLKAVIRVSSFDDGNEGNGDTKEIPNDKKSDFKPASHIHIVLGDITTFSGDAVVNAANEYLKCGGGVCGAIFKAAGYEQLTKACNAIGHCGVGNSVVTPGFNMKVKHIIHTVGPRFDPYKGLYNDELLYHAYESAFRLAVELKCKSIALPSLSTGHYHFPPEYAVPMAVEAITRYAGRLIQDVYIYVREDTFSFYKKEFAKRGIEIG